MSTHDGAQQATDAIPGNLGGLADEAGRRLDAEAARQVADIASRYVAEIRKAGLSPHLDEAIRTLNEQNSKAAHEVAAHIVERYGDDLSRAAKQADEAYRQNLANALEQATREPSTDALREAIRAAEFLPGEAVRDVLRQFSGGWSTLLQEALSRIAEGERQQVARLAALAAQVRVLKLTESTRARLAELASRLGSVEGEIRAMAAAPYLADHAREISALAALNREAAEAMTTSVREAAESLRETTWQDLALADQAAAEYERLVEGLPQELVEDISPPIAHLSREASRAFFDREAQRRLGVSGEEFLRRWHAGEYDAMVDDPDHPEIMELAAIRSFGR